MKKLRTLIEIVANNRSSKYKQWRIVKVRLRLLERSLMVSSRFFSIDELCHVMLTYYNFLYNKQDLNTTAFSKYFEGGEAYHELAEMTIAQLLASSIKLHSFELEFIMTSSQRSTIDSLINSLASDASNSKYSFNANIYLSFADVQEIESKLPISDINSTEVDNFILYRALERSYNSPIAQEEYLLEELENLYPSRPYNRNKRKTQPTSSTATNRPTTSRQANLQDLELSRIEDLFEKELEDDDDEQRAKRGRGIAAKSRLLDNYLGKYFH